LHKAAGNTRDQFENVYADDDDDDDGDENKNNDNDNNNKNNSNNNSEATAAAAAAAAAVMPAPPAPPSSTSTTTTSTPRRRSVKARSGLNVLIFDLGTFLYHFLGVRMCFLLILCCLLDAATAVIEGAQRAKRANIRFGYVFVHFSVFYLFFALVFRFTRRRNGGF
jgi:hypothetical protein